MNIVLLLKVLNTQITLTRPLSFPSFKFLQTHSFQFLEGISSDYPLGPGGPRGPRSPLEPAGPSAPESPLLPRGP